MSKFIVGLVVGLVAFASMGLIYKPFGYCEVDVRVVTVDGHDYVVSTARDKLSCDAGYGVGIVHHAGCKKCNNNVSNER